MLSINQLKNRFIQSVSNGFFLATLFSDHLPFVELNGEKIAGTTDEIIDTLEKMGMVERSRGLNDDTTEIASVVEVNGHKKLQSAIQKVSKAKKGEKFFGVLKKV